MNMIQLKIKSTEEFFQDRVFNPPIHHEITRYLCKEHEACGKHFKVSVIEPHTLRISNKRHGEEQWKNVYDHVVRPVENSVSIQNPAIMEEVNDHSEFLVRVRNGNNFISIEFKKDSMGDFFATQESTSLHEHGMMPILRELVKSSLRSKQQFLDLNLLLKEGIVTCTMRMDPKVLKEVDGSNISLNFSNGDDSGIMASVFVGKDPSIVSLGNFKLLCREV